MRYYRPLFLPLITLLLFSCNQQKNIPTGIASFNDLLDIAVKIHATGDHELLFRHTDISNVPLKKQKEIKGVLENWKGMDSKMAIEKVESQSPEDYNPYELMPKDWPEDFKNQFKPMAWGVEPEKYIVIYVKPKKGNGGSIARWTFGTFQHNKLWYFSAGYKN